MSYRPITDTWILARAKLKGGRKYYGAYPGGFPERARVLLGVNINQRVLHVCGGMARYYPYAGGFGPNDATLDLAEETDPDHFQDARDAFPCCFGAYLIDPPYTPDDADKYAPGAGKFPSANQLVKNAIDRLEPGGRVGILHYIWPSPPKNSRSVAAVSVLVGFNNRVRLFSVFEKLPDPPQKNPPKPA